MDFMLLRDRCAKVFTLFKRKIIADVDITLNWRHSNVLSSCNGLFDHICGF